jgi:hypothetical protein
VRERNALLLAAGYAPLYRETDLGAPEMADARHARGVHPGQAGAVPRGSWWTGTGTCSWPTRATHRFLALFLPAAPAGPST